MKKKIFLMNKPTCLLIIGLFLSTFYVNAQDIEKVLPNGYESTKETQKIAAPLINNSRKYQLLIAETELVKLADKQLKSITFRLPTDASSAWPATDVTFNDYKIYLGEAVNPADRSDTYSNNVVGELTQVRAGDLLIPAESFTVGNTPNEFGFEITFDTPWKYNGGNLLIEIENNGSNGDFCHVDAVFFLDDSNYGSLFAALFGDVDSPNASIISGSFAVIKITAEDSLGNEYTSLVNDGVSTYPNPASNNVFIKSSTNIQSLSLYNTAGQLVLNKVINNSTKEFDLNISTLSNGVYILKVKTEDSIKTKKIIKK